MAYNDKEISVDEGSPFFLYEFNTEVNGVSRSYYYTGHSEIIDWGGYTWEPLPIKHGEIKQSSEMSKNSTNITLPLDNEFSLLFKGWSPDKVVTVNIRRGHFGEPDTLIYWKGRVSSHKIKDYLLELQAESIFTSLRNSGARARFQRTCRHALYSKGCNVDKSLFAVVGKVSDVQALVLTIPEASTKTSGWFDQGFIEFSDGSTRMIVSHVGDQITINRPSRFISDNFAQVGYGLSYGKFYGGMSATLYPGCDRTLTTCRDKFNNLNNQGGFKWIPTKNPMGGSSIV